MVLGLIFLPRGFIREDYEKIFLTLRNRGINLRICVDNELTSDYYDINLEYSSYGDIEKIAEDYDFIILVDSPNILDDLSNGTDYFSLKYKKVIDLVKIFNEKNKKIIAYGNSIAILAMAGVIEGKEITMPTSETDKTLLYLVEGMGGYINSVDEYVISENLITGKNSLSISFMISNLLQEYF